MFDKMKLAARAIFGDASAEGEIQVIELIRKLKQDWAIFRGHQGCGPTVEALVDFFSSTYDVYLDDLAERFSPDALLSREQLETLWTTVARQLLRQGMVSFDGGHR